MGNGTKRLLVIAGPTAVGKTALAIEIALYLHTEIISADSRQIFSELSIGTAKPSSAELQQVKHHFIGSHSIHDHYDAAQYADDALRLIRQLFESHDDLVLCGGSGLYVKAVLEGFDEIPEVAGSVREELIHQYTLHGLDWLQRKMEELDPQTLKRIDRNNPQRVIRALEVKLGTGFSISFFQQKRKRELEFQVTKIGLELPRHVLYDRINKRVDNMIRAGLLDEAAALFPFRHLNALQTVGYQEIFAFMEGKTSREEAIDLLKRNTRRYAKRQLTWFKRDPEMKWFYPDDKDQIIEWITREKN
jgi:tRNA dimethylallyltransferase